jgi:hypothetical protein
MAGAIHANRHDINVDWILDNLQLRTIVFELHQSFEKASERFAFRQGLPARQCVFLDERLALEASRKARSPAEFR